MKCPNCGLINPDTALRCDCGYDFSSQATRESYDPRKHSSNHLKGVGGWLRFFVIVRIYLDPIITGLLLVVAWVGGYPAIADEHGGGVILAGLIETAVSIVLIVKGVHVGIGLRDVNRGAVQATKRWLLLVLIWKIISPFPSLLLGFPAKLLVPEAIKDILKTMISFGIWYSYFKVSKRVKATYSDWADKSVSHLPTLAPRPGAKES